MHFVEILIELQTFERESFWGRGLDANFVHMAPDKSRTNFRPVEYSCV